MGAERSQAQAVVMQFLTRANKAPAELGDDLGLYGDGLELDSLEAAELSALLEDEFGADPFTAGDTMPETVGEILDFYNRDPVTR